MSSGSSCGSDGVVACDGAAVAVAGSVGSGVDDGALILFLHPFSLARRGVEVSFMYY
jgi:hypothetical protein